MTVQQLLSWVPCSAEGRTPSFGDINIESASSQTLDVTLPFKEGKLIIRFNDVRAFATSWDGDPNPFLTNEEAMHRPSDLLRVERSRWLASEFFSLEVESGSRLPIGPWQHFCIIAQDRSVHIAARDDVVTNWVSGSWTGGPGSWEFVP